jgi:asparagine N-glycosylation enzyme membrane subunit Stt3
MVGAIVLSAIAVACAYILWTIADKRGANTLFWAVMGAVFGPLAIPFIFLTTKKSSESSPPEKE